jgi:predicted enzyme related to lactoylglutathione lyase
LHYAQVAGSMSALEVLGIDNVLFAVGDFDAARRFYADTLGLTPKFEVPGMGLAGFRLGMRSRPSSSGPVGDRPRIWLEVADARAAAAELRARGVEPLAEPFEVQTGWTVEFADPAGNMVGQASRDGSAAAELRPKKTL